MTGPVDLLVASLRHALDVHGVFATEDGRAHDEQGISLQDALESALPLGVKCERELPITFAGALVPPPEPPVELGAGKDVCERSGRARRLDMLLRYGDETLALEVKHRRITKWSGAFRGRTLLPRKEVDTYSYEFLKDVHRLERLLHVDSAYGLCTPSRRFALFLTNDPYEFEGRVPHNALKLAPRSLPPKHLVQFNRLKRDGQPTSPNTLWVSYPPFCLAGSYEIRWVDLENDISSFQSTVSDQRCYPTSRLLLLEVPGGLHDGRAVGR